MDRIIKRCTRCVLPENFPNIKFDPSGVCNVCLDYDRKWRAWKSGGSITTSKKLSKIFNNARKIKNRYDCLVPFSGGKDSTYVLYLCKRVFNLDVLAFNFNNGFQTEAAIRNISHAVTLLDVDLITVSPRWGLMKELFSSFLVRAGEPCTPCNMGIELGSYKIAQQENIPLIIMGTSPRTEECSPKEIYTYNKEYFMNVLKKNKYEPILAGTIYESLKRKASVINRKKCSVSQKVFNKLDSPRIASILNTPLRIYLPEYIEWNENEMFGILKEELKWGEATFGKEHMDCEISPVKCYLRYQRWGFGSKTQKYAALVRDGQMDREIALELLKNEGNEPKENLSYLLNRLELTPKHLEEIKRSYHLDYL